MAPQGFSEAPLSKFFSGLVEGFCDAVGVEGNRVTGEKAAVGDRAIPFPEEAQNGAGRVQLFDGAISAEQESGEMSAVGVAQVLRLVVIFSEEEHGVGAVVRIFV